MTPFLKIFLPFFLLFLCASCNNATSKKTTETSKVENVVQIKNDYKSGKWLEDLPLKTPLTFNELEELLPKSLLGKPLVKVIDDTKMLGVRLEVSILQIKSPLKKAKSLLFI